MLFAGSNAYLNMLLRLTLIAVVKLSIFLCANANGQPVFKTHTISDALAAHLKAPIVTFTGSVDVLPGAAIVGGKHDEVNPSDLRNVSVCNPADTGVIRHGRIQPIGINFSGPWSPASGMAADLKRYLALSDDEISAIIAISLQSRFREYYINDADLKVLAKQTLSACRSKSPRHAALVFRTIRGNLSFTIWTSAKITSDRNTMKLVRSDNLPYGARFEYRVEVIDNLLSLSLRMP